MILPIILVFLATNLTLISLSHPVYSGAASVYSDVIAQEKWGDYALEHSIASLYEKNMTDYPPLYLYALYFNAWLNYQISRNHSGSAAPGTYWYVFISKVIPLFCNLLIGLLLFFALRRWNLNKAVVAAAVYLFNPAIALNTSYLGQVDSVYTVFVLLALVFLIDKKYFLSTLFAFVAVLTKVQAVFFLPILAVVLLVNLSAKKLLRLIVGALAFFLAIMLPFLGVIQNIVSTIIKNFGEYPYVTVNALNIWFVLFGYPVPYYVQAVRDTNTVLGISLRTWGYLLLGVYTAVVMYQVFKAPGNIAIGSASLAFASFMLPTEIHERYLFPFFALFLLTALEKRKYLSIYVSLTITYLLNMMLAMNLSNSYILLYSVALVNVVVFAYFTFVGICGSSRTSG